jgi:hypothetical protein
MKTKALVLAILAAGLFSGAGASLGAPDNEGDEFLYPAVFIGCMLAFGAILCAVKSDGADRSEP